MIRNHELKDQSVYAKPTQHCTCCICLSKKWVP